jgi:site-specific DNA recombinase
VFYGRMSTTKQEASIAEQHPWAHRTAPREGVEIVREFQDEAIPGDEISRRHGLLAMLDFCVKCHAEGNPIEVVVTCDADRFSRANSIVTNAILAPLMQAGVCRMLTAEGWVDFDDDMDRLMFNIKQDMAKAMYVKSLSRNVTRSCVERAKKGRWTGGRRPHGYTLGPDGRLAVGDPAAAEAVRWLFAHYAGRDTSLLLMAEALEARGAPPPCPSRRGQTPRWTRYNVYEILHNPIYTGDLYYNRRHYGKYHRVRNGQVVHCKAARTKSGRLRWCHNPGEDVIVVENAHPALVDRETFALVQQKLATHKPRFKPGTTRRRFDWIFSGLAFCADCDRPLWGLVAQRDKESKDGTRHYEWRKYVCSSCLTKGRKGCSFNGVHEDVLLARVADAIRDHFADPSRAAELRRAVEENRRADHADAAARIPGLRKQLTRLDAEIDAGTDRLLKLPEDLVDAAAHKVRKWKERREALTAELKALEAEQEARRQDEVQVDAVIGTLQRLGELIGTAPPDLVRETMRSLIEKVVIHFEHEDRGQRRRSVATHGYVYLNLHAAQFSDAGIELPMSLK